MPSSSSPQKTPISLARRLYEASIFCILLFAIYLLIALSTYHLTDPAWHTTGNHQNIANAGGRIGAWIADFLLYMLGYVAYLFPLFGFTMTYVVWKKDHSKQLLPNKKNLIFFSLGALLLFIGFSGWIDLLFSLFTFNTHLPHNAGGVFGSWLHQTAIKWLNVTGAELLFTGFLFSGLIMLSNISYFIAFQKTSHLLKKLILQTTQQLYQKSSQTIRKLPKVLKTVFTKNTLGLKRYFKKTSSHEESLQTHKNGNFCEPVSDKNQTYSPLKAVQKTLSKNSLSLDNRDYADPLLSAVSVDEVKTASHHSSALLNKQASKQGMQPQSKKNSATQPQLALLNLPTQNKDQQISKDKLHMQSQELEQYLRDFGIQVKVVSVYPGPVITRFELEPAPGIKVSRITALSKDLARALSTVSVRVVEIIPGKTVIGLEIPNAKRQIVALREILQSSQYQTAHAVLSLALGKDIAGHPVVVDLAKMPHLLVAGTTGAGKSVALNVMLLSLLYKSTPEQVRLILVDPKMLELSVYEGIPHLLTPVVTDMKDAANALRWSVAEMERRYKLMAQLGTRNLANYNQKIKNSLAEKQPILHPFEPVSADGTANHLAPLPNIVVLIDEFADMMMVVGKKVEELIARLAQKARAAGIHLILATQRPSVDVITGLIKANIPTRIAFQVSSKIDSRTILDQQGAEQLLGHGDMLYLPPGTAVPIRVHGAYVSDEEVHRVVTAIKNVNDAPNYLIDTLSDDMLQSDEIKKNGLSEEKIDPLYDEAVAFIQKTKRVSISSIQRRFKIGYNRAANLVENMEAAGLVSSMSNTGTRTLLEEM